MTIKVAINGYGRIGRNALRAIYEANRSNEIEVVAINSLSTAEQNIHLTRYDSTHGRFSGEVKSEGNDMVVNGNRIKVFNEKEPEQLPWGDLDVDVVYECTGVFTKRELAAKHLKAGAKKVNISAPAKNADATIVYGVNHHILKPEHQIVSNASCTTNCLAPIAKILHESVGIEAGLMLTVHAYTNDQVLVDSNHADLHRARSATQSIIPTKTGAAVAVGLVIPELAGKLDGYATRVPTLNVSMVDLTFNPSRKTTIDEINRVLSDAANGPLKGILGINDEPLVSIDFNHNPLSSIYDKSQTRIIGNLVKIVSWYDNEWGFSNRMLDVTMAMMKF